MKKIKISLFIFIVFFMFVLVYFNNRLLYEKTKNVNTKVSLSNKKISWGIKRNSKNEQPEFGDENKNLIEKYKGISMGNSMNKNIYLTFDAGYEAGYTEKILEVLKQNNVNATFFLTGHYINSQPTLVRKMIEQGHIIGNHTVNHKNMPDLEDEELKNEIMNLHSVIYEKFGYEMKYIRPPKGEYSERTLDLSNKLGYKTVMWSFAYEDWDENKQGKKEYSKEKIINNLHNGEIMLLHSTSKDNSDILDECIKEIKSKGFEFRSIEEFEELEKKLWWRRNEKF